jgi:hypothetical protein
MVWLLGDFSRDAWKDTFTHKAPDGTSLGSWGLENLGKVVCLGPFEGHTTLDLTAPPGVASGVYYGMVFQLGKWEFKVHKADEAIEVSPVHAQYYQLTLKQKEDLEAKIKSGLAQAAQAIGDFELLKHDERKYREFLNYHENRDEHSLRAVFIDQVDVHNGDTGLRNIVQRWPTIIADFMRCGDPKVIKEEETVDVEKVKEKLKVSRAEAVVLVTKNRLYREWKRLFVDEVRSRLERIGTLALAREASIKQYREWLRPYVTRFRLLKQAFEDPGARKRSASAFIAAGGHAVSESVVRIWSWKDVSPPEIRRAAPELVSERPIDPYDDFIKRELIWNPGRGLVADYPWITPSWVDKAAADIKREWMVANKLYYGFLEVDFIRTNMRMASGAEIEDGTFKINVVFMSQNALLAKLLELKCKQEEMERYINELLGLSKPEEKLASIEDIKLRFNEERRKLEEARKRMKAAEEELKKAKEEDDKLKAQKRLNEAKGGFEKQEKKIAEMETMIGYMEAGPSFGEKLKGFVGYRGPYEWNINERLAKYLIKPMAESSYVALIGFLKDKFGVGRT